MSILARITAIVFIVAGLAIILFGIWFGVSGIQTSKPQSTPQLFDMSGLVMVVQLFGGIAIGMQGFLLAAIGESLWLLAGIFEQTQRTADILARLTRKNQ